MFTRRTILAASACAALPAGSASLVEADRAAATEVRSVRITRYRVTPDRWPTGVDLRIAVLADLHAHPRCMGVEEIRAVVARTNALRPDLVVLLGDYGSQEPAPVAPEVVADLMRGLSAPRGVYAIQGNHDWTDDVAAVRLTGGPTRVERAFRAAGIPFLENAAVPLGPDLPVWIAGIESEEAPSAPGAVRRDPQALDRHRTGTLRRILERVPADASVILLAHEPDIFATGLDPRIDLTLSGHTHGGQIRIAGWSPWIPSRYGLRYAYGHVVENARHLVVSGGLGSHFVAGRPLRIGMPPEIVVVDVGSHGVA